MKEAPIHATIELFGENGVDEIINAINGKREQIDVILDLIYPYFTHKKPGARDMLAIQLDFAKIGTMLEIASDALQEIKEQVERWNKITAAICEKARAGVTGGKEQ